MRIRSAFTLLTLASLAIAPLAVQAHPLSTVPAVAANKQDAAYLTDLGRAKNLARQAAEEANGGLSEYWAEPSMHGPADESPYVDNGDGTWTFTVFGGAPASEVYDIETVVLVERGTWAVTVLYNGPVR